MPRGRKKSVPAEVEQVVVNEVNVAESTLKKPYPSIDERIVAADVQIARLEALNESRKALIEQTEYKLNERKEALAKSESMLEKAVQKKERLIASKNTPAKAESARAKKAAEKKQTEELLAAIKASGKSVEEILSILK